MNECMDNLSLNEMVRRLRGVGDIAWGRYAFSHDLLRGRVPFAKQDEMTLNAAACGIEWARRMTERTGAADPDSMREALGLTLTENDLDMTENPRPLFAQFIPDNRIEIMCQPVRLYTGLYEREADRALLPRPEEVRALLLAHELFHHVEELYKDEIYSRTVTIRLWKLFFIKWDSTVRAVGEIAAMSFAKALTGAGFSPFLLDVLLLFGYNQEHARHVFKSILEISNAVAANNER